MRLLHNCSRCGAAVEATAAIACTTCGAPLPPSDVNPVTVSAASTAHGSSVRRLSRMATLPDLPPLPSGRRVRRRHLSPPEAAIGPDYELHRVLGEGGMGVVWSARQAGLGREVAIKRARPGAGARATEQLLAEAELTGALEHPGIVPIHEVGIDQDGVPFYAMRRLRGRTWNERWRELSLREHLDVLLRVCDAVAYAHGQGVIHRDLKPGNVFLGSYGEVVVFDWGLAVRVQELRDGGRPLLASGTPSYMAPEMARAEAGDLGPCSDIYLLGAMLYEILTDVAPHPGEATTDILIAAASNVIEPPIPPGELGDVARQAMASKPGDRFADVPAFQAALRTCIDHQESVLLAARAAERLTEAQGNAGYAGFARALHGFEDALDLWTGNRSASRELSIAKRLYAGRARGAGDLDLAGSLLNAEDSTHHEELAQIASLREQRRRRRRALRALGWSTGVLLVVLVSALVVGYLAVSKQRDLVLRVSHERDNAEAALVRQTASAAEHRTWRRIVQEDFSSVMLPSQARVLSGRWGITEASLVAEGSQPAIMSIPLPSTDAVMVQIDVEPGGRFSLIVSDEPRELARGQAGKGMLVSIDRLVSVYRGGGVLVTAPLPEAVTGLARRIRVDFDGAALRILVDGKAVVSDVQLMDLRCGVVGLIAEQGTVLDNLKIEVPWVEPEASKP